MYPGISSYSRPSVGIGPGFSYVVGVILVFLIANFQNPLI